MTNSPEHSLFSSCTELAEITRGTFIGVDLGSPIDDVIVDSRQAGPGKVFVGLPGEKVDGGSFARRALEAGCVGVLVEEKWREAVGNGPAVVVKDGLAALQRLATWYRSSLDLPIAGVTGSVGKTTLVAMAFASFQDVFRNPVKTYRNYNGQIGLPLSLFRLTAEHDAAVLEMGISETGEMARLGQMAKPNVALVANIQAVHIEGLGSIDGVQREKLELLNHLPDDGVAVLNAEDPRVMSVFGTLSQRTITYGRQDDADIRLVGGIEQGEDGLRFKTNVTGDRVVFLPALGAFNVTNALGALALVEAMGKKPMDAYEALAYFQQEGMRQRRVGLGQNIDVIMDAYNASETSMIGAVDILVSLAKERRAVAILGDMYELGDEAPRAHKRLAEALSDRAIDVLLFAGEYGQTIRQSLVGFPGEVMTFPNTSSLVHAVPHIMEPGDMVLLKASRGMQFERVLEALEQNFGV